MMMLRTRFDCRLTFFGAVLILGGAGCGIFDTRSPEPPDTGQEIPWNNPTSPSIVLDNIEATLEGKSVTNYEGSLTDDFSFTPAAVDEADIGADFFLNWGKEDEVSVHQQILSSSAALDLRWSNVGPTIPAQEQGENGEVQEYFPDLGYELVWTESGRSATYSGQVDLYLRETGGVWSIYDWIDKSDGSANESWGRLRWLGAPELQ